MLMDIEIVSSFEKTLFDPSLGDAISELAEIGIDSMMESELVKSVPVVGIVIGATKTVVNIRDRYFLRQTGIFINSFNNGTINDDVLEKHREKIASDSAWAEEELSRVIILIDRTLESYKAKMLGNAYRSYVMEEITWADFCELSAVIDKLFVEDIPLLRDISNGEVKETTPETIHKVERLNSLGLLIAATITMVGASAAKQVKLSILGELLIRHCYENSLNNGV